MKPQKSLILFSLFVMILLSIGVPLLSQKKESPFIPIETIGQPTIGNENSPVHMVVIEEPKCPFCREYTRTIYTKIKSTYIDTGKISYSTIIVSFLPKSMPGAIGLMYVYHGKNNRVNPVAFFAYLDLLYANQGDEESDWLQMPLLLKLAKETSPEIDLDEMEKSILNENYRSQIEENTRYARKLMNGSLTTPAIFINGSYIEDVTYREISKKIDGIIKKDENREDSK